MCILFKFKIKGGFYLAAKNKMIYVAKLKMVDNCRVA